MLPDGWLPVARGGGILVGYMADPQSFKIQRCIFVLPCGMVFIEVHGKPLPKQHELWSCVKRVTLNQNSVVKFSNNILSMISLLCRFEICNGVEAFEDLSKKVKNAVVDNNRYLDNRCSKICRGSDCLMLVRDFHSKRSKSCETVQAIYCVSCQSKAKQTRTTTPPDAKRLCAMCMLLSI